MRKPSILFCFCLLFSGRSLLALTSWSFTIPSTQSGSFSASESTVPATVNGNFFRLTNGFIRLTVTSSSGTGAPAAGTVRYAVEAPGFALFAQPLLSTEGTPIVMAATGSCPDETWNGLFSYFIWTGNPGTTYDVSSASTPAFGAYSWNPATNIATISSVRNLTSYGNLAGFSSFTNAGTCSNGAITFTGGGDRSGTLYVTTGGGGVYATGTNRGMFLVPQVAIGSASRLDGTYTTFSLDTSLWPQTISSMRITISGGTSGSGDTLTDIAADTTNSAETWSLSSIAVDSPVNGAFTGSLQLEGGTARNIACLAYFSERNTFFCAAQSPANGARPMNFMMVSDTPAIPASTMDSYAFGGTSGYTTTSLSSGTDTIYNVELQNDGKIVAVASDGSDTFLLRYLPSGNLDTTFATGGKRALSISGGDLSGINNIGLSIDSSGKIYVSRHDSSLRGIVARYTDTGAIDSSFGTSGRTTNSYSSGIKFSSNALHANGRIVSAGNCNNGFSYDFCLYRHLTSGAIDSSFGSSGRIIYTRSGDDQARNVVIQSNNAIVLSGASYVSTNYRFLVARVTSAGVLDSSFGTNGRTVTTITSGADDVATGVALQPDGKILVAGASGNPYDAVVARYTTAGSLDTTFGSGGFVKSDISSRLNWIRNIALQPDGKIVGSGRAESASDYEGAIYRYTSLGVLDTTFNTTGYLVLTDATSDDEFYDLALQADKKVVVGGTFRDDLFVGRFWMGSQSAQSDSYKPLLDRLSVSAAAAYSLRKLRWSYTGYAIRVRRSSDSSTQDIGFDYLNRLDTSALSSFCSGTSCYIRTWYDQSGNGKDATQTTNGSQPRIVSAGTTETCSNSLPAIHFVASSSYFLNIPSLLSGLSALSVNFISQNNSTSAWGRFFDFGTGETVNLFVAPTSGTNARFRITTTGSGGEMGPGSLTAISNNLTALTFLHSGSTMAVYQDGALLGSTGSITIAPSAIAGSQNYIGKSQYAADPYLNAKMQEFLIFGSSLSASDRTILDTDQFYYWDLP